jgi:hypothetical protein
MLEQDNGNSAIRWESSCRRNQVPCSPPAGGRGIVSNSKEMRATRKVWIGVKEPPAVPIQANRLHMIIEEVIIKMSILLRKSEHSATIISMVIDLSSALAASGKLTATECRSENVLRKIILTQPV